MVQGAGGFTLPELMVTAVVLALLAAVAIGESGRFLALQRVESVTRRVSLGLEMGRAAAERLGQPCALQLSERGWHGPAGGSLAPCEGVDLPLEEGTEAGAIQLEHNLPEVVRFSSNGLVLDGGTVLVSAAGTDLVRCVVMSLPLGVVRHGRYGEGGCRPDPAP